jgi:glycosyltransferase involved in cell wall biosynthesis
LEDRESIRSDLGVTGVTFIYVGRLWSGKGLDYLLDAFKRLQTGCQVESSLLLVGDGPEDGHLRKRCQKQGIRNVVFAGFQQRHKLPQYYTASDVFIFPTLGDPYGLVVDEAMASFLPVISTDAAGEIRDRIEDGVNGYIVPAENSEALFERMKHLAYCSNLRSVMGYRSYDKVKGRTPERWAKDFEQAVTKILARPK